MKSFYYVYVDEPYILKSIETWEPRNREERIEHPNPNRADTGSNPSPKGNQVEQVEKEPCQEKGFVKRTLCRKRMHRQQEKDKKARKKKKKKKQQISVKHGEKKEKSVLRSLGWSSMHKINS